MDFVFLFEFIFGFFVCLVMFVVVKYFNFVSVKCVVELKRIDEFEEENMIWLVISKREVKRRRDDEVVLVMGFGVGLSRGRRGRNGLEVELEGVFGDRGDKGVWDGVLGKFG